MSRLYLANCTVHNQRVYYRLDVNPDGSDAANARFRLPKSQDVPSGRQVVLGGDLHISQIESIVDQLNVYGMVGVKDAAGRLKGVVPYVFDIDKAVPSNVIRTVFEHNSGVKRDEGKIRRQKAAVAANEVLSAKVEAAPQVLEVEYEQQDDAETEGPKIEEGIRVEPARQSSHGRKRGA